MTTPATAAAEGEFRRRMQIEGDLGEHLCLHLWDNFGTLHLGPDDFEIVGCEDVPGYEDDDTAVLLRRKPDGKVFEAEIEVTVRPALTLEDRKKQAARAQELAGQLRLPGVPS